MKTSRFSEAFGNIPEDLVSEAVTYKSTSKKKSFIKWGAMAACLCLLVMGGVFGNLFRSPDVPNNGNNILSYFVITAHAANGESTELGIADGCFNSGTSEGNIFGVDMPIFNFSVKPTDLKSNEALYERFDISISYNGNPVKDKDEHVQVAFLIPIQPSDEPWSYSISGWFTEPTDIFVTITDKESKAVVEEITVRVSYDANRQEYELKIINLDTEYVK